MDTFRHIKPSQSTQKNVQFSFAPNKQYQRPYSHSVGINVTKQHYQNCNCQNQQNILKNKDKLYSCQICNRLRAVCPYMTTNYCLRCFKNQCLCNTNQNSSYNQNIRYIHSSPKKQDIKIVQNRTYIDSQYNNFTDSINTTTPTYVNKNNFHQNSVGQKYNRSVSTKIPLERSILSTPSQVNIIQQFIFYPVIHNKYVHFSSNKKKLNLSDMKNSHYERKALNQSSIRPNQAQPDKKRKKKGIFNTSSKKNIARKSYDYRPEEQYHPDNQNKVSQIQISDFLNNSLPANTSNLSQIRKSINLIEYNA